jgi:hypothetical protein
MTASKSSRSMITNPNWKSKMAASISHNMVPTLSKIAFLQLLVQISTIMQWTNLNPSIATHSAMKYLIFSLLFKSKYELLNFWWFFKFFIIWKFLCNFHLKSTDNSIKVDRDASIENDFLQIHDDILSLVTFILFIMKYKYGVIHVWFTLCDHACMTPLFASFIYIPLFILY